MAYMNKSGSPKKKTKGPRIALHLPPDAQGLYTRGLAIWNAIKADTTHFPTTYPPAHHPDGAGPHHHRRAALRAGVLLPVPRAQARGLPVGPRLDRELPGQVAIRPPGVVAISPTAPGGMLCSRYTLDRILGLRWPLALQPRRRA